MRRADTPQTATNASPASASTAVGAVQFKGSMFKRSEKLTVDALITAGAGGTLDVYLQRKIASDTWRDWIHFPQVSAGVTKRYALSITGDGASIVEVGGGSDASPGVGLAANTAVNVIPGGDVRVVLVAGAGTSGAGTTSITIQPYVEY